MRLTEYNVARIKLNPGRSEIRVFDDEVPGFGVRFRGGTGSCVIDTYLTRIGHHHYQEIACLAQGRTSGSVIVAAAPAAQWANASPVLFRAVAAYQVR